MEYRQIDITADPKIVGVKNGICQIKLENVEEEVEYKGLFFRPCWCSWCWPLLCHMTNN